MHGNVPVVESVGLFLSQGHDDRATVVAGLLALAAAGYVQVTPHLAVA